jgi:hypothetical protein
MIIPIWIIKLRQIPFIHFSHIMDYLLTKEETEMAFGNVECCENRGCGCEGHGRGMSTGIAAIVVIILLLIAMGIVF